MIVGIIILWIIMIVQKVKQPVDPFDFEAG